MPTSDAELRVPSSSSHVRLCCGGYQGGGSAARLAPASHSSQCGVRHVGVRILDLMEHELGLVLEQELRRALHVDKQRVDLLNVLDLDLDALALGAHERGGDDQLDG